MEFLALSPLLAKIAAGALAVLGIVAAFFINNAAQRKKGREAERDRAWKSQVDATSKAEAERHKAAQKPVTDKRKEVERWED